MNDFVSKPVRKKALIEAMLRVLPRPAVAAATATVAAAPARPPGAVAAPTLRVDRDSFATIIEEIGREATLEIIAMFVKDTAERLAMLRQWPVASHRGEIEREVHALKSAAATFGLHDLAGLARDLEKTASTIDQADYAAVIERMDGAFDAARSAEAADAGCVMVSI